MPVMGGGNPFATVCDSKYAWSPFVERSEQMMACWPRLSNVNVNSDVSGSGATSADELEKLANLQQRGALTDEEFQAENSKLLA
ncbi:MAG: SHOCT domain-containing protein [Acidobacteria bacterium]|nr:MAG: SHOCT domain-containing protein [Acidobacteriota bacterium]